MVNNARHTQRTHITHAHLKHTPHAYSNTRRRITLTHHVHALRLRSTFTIRLARHTLTTHHNYTDVSKVHHTTHIFAHTRVDSRSRITQCVHASRSRPRLRSKFMINLARHTLTTHVTQAHQKLHKPHGYSRTRRRITLTLHAHAPRSRITFTHLVQSSRLRSTFMINLASHTITAHAHYTSVSKAPHTTSIFAHTRRRITLTHHAFRYRVTFTHRAYAPRS
jgi:hypothetical protein